MQLLIQQFQQFLVISAPRTLHLERTRRDALHAYAM